MSIVKRTALLLLLAAAAACASSSKPIVESTEPRRALGTENGVRLDVELYSETLKTNTNLPLKYDITNHRNETILVADLIPQGTYDSDTLTVTVNLGTEIPGEQFLPRLIAIRPGERKTFSVAAHVVIAANPGTPWTPKPNGVRIRLNFLDDTNTFSQLIDIKEKAVYDPNLASALFQKWVENNETVVTNILPMRWQGVMTDDSPTPATSPARRGRGRGPG
ncbi:MAG TPA: hypothetical protein VG323_15625 [Thermoanaerobaculia bacterium]|nr:hypothetical protein [Thermoanaerobaculia bacterium]